MPISFWWLYRKQRDNIRHRYDPVPGTRKWKASSRGMHRRPQTTQEICAGEALIRDEDARYYGVKLRGRRRPSMIPGHWDDLCSGSWRDDKNWKHNRKHQWKGK